jgi:hypothetical protein
MSYHYSKYELVGPESDLARGTDSVHSGQRVLRAYWYVSTEFSGAESDFRRNIPIGPNSRYQTRYAQVGCSTRANLRGLTHRRSNTTPERTQSAIALEIGCARGGRGPDRERGAAEYTTYSMTGTPPIV